MRISFTSTRVVLDVPMGAQRDDFKDATTLAGQAAWELSTHWHILGTIGWTHGPSSRSRTWFAVLFGVQHV